MKFFFQLFEGSLSSIFNHRHLLQHHPHLHPQTPDWVLTGLKAAPRHAAALTSRATLSLLAFPACPSWNAVSLDYSPSSCKPAHHASTILVRSQPCYCSRTCNPSFCSQANVLHNRSSPHLPTKLQKTWMHNFHWPDMTSISMLIVYDFRIAELHKKYFFSQATGSVRNTPKKKSSSMNYEWLLVPINRWIWQIQKQKKEAIRQDDVMKEVEI